MTISIIIPAYNEEKYIGACLERIIKYAPENLKEIIVVNNASMDKTAEVAAAFHQVRVVNEPAKGLTKARQRGFVESTGDILAFVDADSLVPENWFTIINQEFTNSPKPVFLSGPYIYLNTPAWQKWCVKWLYWNFLARVIYFFTGYMATGGNMIMSKNALREIGGFDTNIAFYGEDTDIVRRMRKAGKTKFNFNLVMLTSARRFEAEGTLKTGINYAVNYASVMLTKKPATKDYKDIR
jgi:glycosyltransferase involved in cell wall biosynthesis